MNYIDLALILICALSVFFAYRKGFFYTLMDLTGKIIGLIVARIVSNAYAGEVYKTLFKSDIQTLVEGKLGGLNSVDAGESVQAVLESIPSSFDGVLKLLGISRESLIAKAEGLNLNGENIVKSVMKEIVNPVATSVCRVLLYVAVFIASIIVLKFVLKIVLKVIATIPLLKKADKFLGSILGLARGLIIALIIIFIITFVAGLLKMEPIDNIISSSKLISLSQYFTKSISGSI